nr:MAG TPA: hypothetical protein [Caudoviricetes sp.]
MKITLEFSTGQELDCRMLEGAMTAMSRCLLNHLSSDVVSEPAAEGDALEEVNAEAVAPVEEKPLVVQPKARKPRKSTKTEKKEAEPVLSAESPADSEGEGEAPQTKQEQSDLPFAEGEESKPEPASVPQPKPAPQPTAPTMTAAEFRQKLVELRAQLGVEMETPQALQLSRVISARCNHLYGTTKPSTLPGDKLYEFVHNEMMNLTWNADHTDFEDQIPF